MNKFIDTILAIITIFVLISQGHAAEVILQWDANQPAPDGYRLYQRTDSANYDETKPVNQDLIKGTTYTVRNLIAGTKYYFVVNAEVGGSRSSKSNEVEHTAVDAPGGLANTTELLHRILFNQDLIIERLTATIPDDPAPASAFCGNPDSKILHKSIHWCGKSAVHFDEVEAAKREGYTSCKVCKPFK